MSILRKLTLAISCVTCLPLAGNQLEGDHMDGLAKYLPTVGIFVGGILLLLAYGLQQISSSALLCAAIIVVSWIILTGALHLDGLMDTADGIFSHRSRERMLDIMRDSRVGNFGVISGVSVMLLKIASLAAVGFPLAFVCVFVVPIWARWSELFAIGVFPYAREEGMGKVWHDTTRMPGDLLRATVLPVLATLASCHFFGIAPTIMLTGFCVSTGLTSAFYLGHILKGHTGDTYGAVVELSEAGSLLLFALILKAS